jgi:type I restriction enzyme R subunit
LKIYWLEDDLNIISIIEDSLVNGNNIIIENPAKPYYERVADFLLNTNEPVISKITNLDALSLEEKNKIENIFNKEIGTKEECVAWCNGLPLLQRVRMDVGISDIAIQTKFGSFLNTTVLTQMQLTFMNQVISYAKMNGDITSVILRTVSPFDNIDISALFGTNALYLKELINGIHKPIL